MKTGWPPGLLQDDDRKLSRWLASRPDARYQLRKNIMKEDILKMAQEAGWHVQGNRVFSPVIEGTDLLWLIERLVTIAEDAQAKRMHAEGVVTVGHMREQIAAERNKVAQWMMAKGYATGHGDTVEDLLQELGTEIEAKLAAERERFYGQDKPAECANGCPPKQLCDYCQVVEPVRAMILAEREACAQIAMNVAINGIETSAAIRARGQE